MRYELIIYWSRTDERFVVEVPELAGCMADGATYLFPCRSNSYVRLVEKSCDAALVILGFLFRIRCISNRSANHDVICTFKKSFLHIDNTLLVVVHETVCDRTNAWTHN